MATEAQADLEVDDLDLELGDEANTEETEAKADLAEAEVEADESEVKVDREKLQKQNRELGNLRRENQAIKQELSEIKDLLKESRKVAETKAEKTVQQELQDEARDLMAEFSDLSDDDFVTAKSVKQAMKKQANALQKLIERFNEGESAKEIRKELNDLKSRTEASERTSRASESFDEVYPELEGQFQKWNRLAVEYAREQVGEDADPREIAGAATTYLNLLAKRAVRTASKKSGSTVTDKTAVNKPATSTKGTSSAKRASAPADDLSKLSDIEVEQLMAEQLGEG